MLLNLDITPDKLQATLTAVVSPGEPFDMGQLTAALADKGITHGLETQALQTVIEQVKEKGRIDGPVVVARGTPGSPAGLRVEPRFASGRMSVEADGQTSEIEVSELVLKDSLVAIVQGDQGKTVTGEPVCAANPETCRSLLGTNVLFDAPTGRITAAIPGYPRLVRQADGSTGVELAPAARISSDGMTAVLALLPPFPADRTMDESTILGMLEQSGVVFGIRHQGVSDCLEQLHEGRLPQVEAVVAHGMLPVHGVNSTIRFLLDIGPIPGKPLANGQIDFRERQLFTGVEENQQIGVKVPATPGEPGCTVRGQRVEARPGKDLPVLVCGDVSFNPGSGEIRAARSGVLSVSGEGQITVCAMQVIEGDVNYGTGNLSSKNALEIKGKIKPHFKVEARGDVVLHGGVEAATVDSRGNIIAKGGITGKFSRLQASGDIDLLFIEHGRAFAGSCLILRRQAYFSRLHSNKDLQCDKNSRVLGGQLVAAGMVHCGTVGSPSTPPAIIASGVHPQLFQKMYDLGRAIAQLEQELTALLPQENINSRISKKISRQRKKIEQIGSELAGLDLTGNDVEPEAMKILVHGTVHRGTLIRIGNATLTLDKDFSRTCFFLDQENGAISSKSL